MKSKQKSRGLREYLINNALRLIQSEPDLSEAVTETYLLSLRDNLGNDEFM